MNIKSPRNNRTKRRFADLGGYSSLLNDSHRRTLGRDDLSVPDIVDGPFDRNLNLPIFGQGYWYW